MKACAAASPWEVRVQGAFDSSKKIALLFSGVLMLRHLKEESAADRIMNSIRKVFREGTHTTRDLGGKSSTEEFADEVIRHL